MSTLGIYEVMIKSIASFLSKKKLDILVSTGLKRVRIGFQSGSPKTLRFYRRPEKISSYIKSNDPLQEHKNIVFPYYDIITDNILIRKGDVAGLPEIVVKLFHKSRRQQYPGDYTSN